MNSQDILRFTGRSDTARVEQLTAELAPTTGTREERARADRNLRTMYALAWADAVALLAKQAAQEEPEGPTSMCGCGFDLVYDLHQGWYHDAAPELWGDDHDPNVDQADEAAARKYAAQHDQEYVEP